MKKVFVISMVGIYDTPVFDAIFPVGNPNLQRILNRGACEQIGADYQGQSVVEMP